MCPIFFYLPLKYGKQNFFYFSDLDTFASIFCETQFNLLKVFAFKGEINVTAIKRAKTIKFLRF